MNNRGIFLTIIFAAFLAGCATTTFEKEIPLLKSPDERIRKRAVVALGKIGDERAVEPLISALKDKKWVVSRNAVVVALGKIGISNVKKVIQAWIKDSQPEQGKNKKVSVLYLFIGYQQNPKFFRPVVEENIALIPLYGKEDIYKRKPTYIIVAHNKRKFYSTGWRIRSRGTIYKLHIHCISVFNNENIRLNWCGQSYKGYRKPKGYRVNEWEMKSPWEDVPPLKIIN